MPYNLYSSRTQKSLCVNYLISWGWIFFFFEECCQIKKESKKNRELKFEFFTFDSSDLRFPLDGAVELHFSGTPQSGRSTPAPTPAIQVDLSPDAVTRWDSYENLVVDSPARIDEDSDTDETGELYN